MDHNKTGHGPTTGPTGHERAIAVRERSIEEWAKEITDRKPEPISTWIAVGVMILFFLCALIAALIAVL